MSHVNQRVGRQGLKDVMNVRVGGERQMMKDVLVSGIHLNFSNHCSTVKPVLSGHSKIDKTTI